MAEPITTTAALTSLASGLGSALQGNGGPSVSSAGSGSGAPVSNVTVSPLGFQIGGLIEALAQPANQQPGDSAQSSTFNATPILLGAGAIAAFIIWRRRNG